MVMPGVDVPLLLLAAGHGAAWMHPPFSQPQTPHHARRGSNSNNNSTNTMYRAKFCEDTDVHARPIASLAPALTLCLVYLALRVSYLLWWTGGPSPSVRVLRRELFGRTGAFAACLATVACVPWANLRPGGEAMFTLRYVLVLHFAMHFLHPAPGGLAFTGALVALAWHSGPPLRLRALEWLVFGGGSSSASWWLGRGGSPPCAEVMHLAALLLASVLVPASRLAWARLS